MWHRRVVIRWECTYLLHENLIYVQHCSKRGHSPQSGGGTPHHVLLLLLWILLWIYEYCVFVVGTSWYWSIYTTSYYNTTEYVMRLERPPCRTRSAREMGCHLTLFHEHQTPRTNVPAQHANSGRERVLYQCSFVTLFVVVLFLFTRGQRWTALRVLYYYCWFWHEPGTMVLLCKIILLRNSRAEQGQRDGKCVRDTITPPQTLLTSCAIKTIRQRTRLLSQKHVPLTTTVRLCTGRMLCCHSICQQGTVVNKKFTSSWCIVFLMTRRCDEAVKLWLFLGSRPYYSHGSGATTREGLDCVMGAWWWLQPETRLLAQLHRKCCRRCWTTASNATNTEKVSQPTTQITKLLLYCPTTVLPLLLL